MSANSKSPIVLTGMMGAGKSTVGTLLARRLGWPFVDLDEFIVERMGKSIAEIFLHDGEAVFREWEHQALEACLSAAKFQVVALGGGTVERQDNRELLQQTFVVWLQAPLSLLYARVCDSGRPLAAGGWEHFKIRYDQRTPWFQSLAQLTVQAGSLSAQDIADSIIDFWDDL
ncbi:MAG: shikimate kinase [Sulfobacillus sp.]